MSTQSFENAFREALWEIHRKKCFYCRRELLLRDVQIDHIVPEYLRNNPAERTDVFKRVGLDDGFSISGLENLAPACSKCNNDKGGAVLHSGSIGIQLARIRDRIPQLEEALKKQRAERDLEDILREITRALGKGKYSSQELIRRLEELHEGTGRALATTLKQPRITFHDDDIRSNRISFTNHALQSLSDRGVSLEDVYQALLGGVKKLRETAKVDPNRPDKFVVRGANRVRVIYTLRNDQITVISVEWADRLQSA